MRSLRMLFLCGAATLLIAGCARGPNAALEHAKSMYSQAANDPQITAQAPVELHDASEDLQRAQQAYDDKKDDDEVSHRAYMAERKVEIARLDTQRKTSENELAHLHDERGDVVLKARTGEAEAAKARTRELERQLSQLSAKETERGLVLTAKDTLFEFDRADLKPGAMRDLYRVADFLKQNPDRQVLTEGYTDSIGTQAYNMQLGQARADTVRNFLLRNGVAPDRLIASGYGKDYPVATNDTAEGRQQNRRVEIVVLDPGKSASASIRQGPSGRAVMPEGTGDATSGAR